MGMRIVPENNSPSSPETISSRPSKTAKIPGVCLARVLFSFLVVCNHFFTAGFGECWILPLRQMAVPVFFILAFYFDAQKRATLIGADWKRLRRILFPFWFWGLFFAPAYLIGFVMHNPDGASLLEALRRIVLQLTLGHVYNAPLWFLFALAFLTLGWRLANRIQRPKFVLQVLLATVFMASVFFQYSGANAHLFGQFEWFVRFPLGRLAECIPFAVVGIVLVESGLVARLRGSRFRLLHLLWILLFCWPRPLVVGFIPTGFGYQGLTCVRSGLFLVLFFLALPMENIPNQIRKWIEIVSHFSLGVYCIHLPIGMILSKILSMAHLHVDNFLRCLAIFLVSLATCVLMTRFFPKSKVLVQ